MFLKIATWNVNSINMRISHLVNLINEHNPDIICLQETKCEDSKFPSDFTFGPYNIYTSGQKSYNGVAIFSKFRASEVSINFDSNPIQSEARFVEITASTTLGFCRIISLYAPNGGEVGSDNFRKKFAFYEGFQKYLDSIVTFDELLFIAGDYNISPYDIDVYDKDLMNYATCFTIEERNIIRSILAKYSLHDQYRIINPTKIQYSWWDYRGMAVNKNEGLRIDYILANSRASDKLTDSFIDEKYRSLQKASDHAPVISVYNTAKS